MKNLLWIAAGWYIGKLIVTLAIIAVTLSITLIYKLYKFSMMVIKPKSPTALQGLHSRIQSHLDIMWQEPLRYICKAH